MNFLWSIAFKKVVKRTVQLVASFMIVQNINKSGMGIDENHLTILLFALIELLRNYLKIKMNVRWL